MSDLGRVTLLTVTFLSLFAARGAFADQCDLEDCGNYPIVWEHDTYGGRCLKLPVSRPGFKNYDFNDVASSVCVPAGWKVVLYEHTNFEGNHLSITGPARIADLKRDRPNGKDWGDKVSSAEVFAPAE